MQPEESLPLSILEKASQSLDITKTQREQIEKSYRGVGEALCESETLRHLSPHIQPQGSVLLGTVVKPAPEAEFDVDATCRFDLDHARYTSEQVFNAALSALEGHGIYGKMVEPKNRCVRIAYAEEKYHLDMTPCVPNNAAPEAVHVPDREHKSWKPSNPQLYAKLFEEVAKKQPTLATDRMVIANSKVALSARIDPLPPEELFRKKLLKRLVQLLKRHRDLHFVGAPHAVISIIVTTLAAKSYGKLVGAQVYPNLLDFATAVIDDMPCHIESYEVGGRIYYRIENPAILDENFAEKWNGNAKLPTAFEEWHRKIALDIREFRRASLSNGGNQILMEKTAAIYGKAPAVRAAKEVASNTARDHREGSLFITPSLSLGAAGVCAPRTSYYGA